LVKDLAHHVKLAQRTGCESSFVLPPSTHVFLLVAGDWKCPAGRDSRDWIDHPHLVFIDLFKNAEASISLDYKRHENVLPKVSGVRLDLEMTTSLTPPNTLTKKPPNNAPVSSDFAIMRGGLPAREPAVDYHAWCARQTVWAARVGAYCGEAMGGGAERLMREYNEEV